MPSDDLDKQVDNKRSNGRVRDEASNSVAEDIDWLIFTDESDRTGDANLESQAVRATENSSPNNPDLDDAAFLEALGLNDLSDSITNNIDLLESFDFDTDVESGESALGTLGTPEIANLGDDIDWQILTDLGSEENEPSPQIEETQEFQDFADLYSSSEPEVELAGEDWSQDTVEPENENAPDLPDLGAFSSLEESVRELAVTPDLALDNSSDLNLFESISTEDLQDGRASEPLELETQDWLTSSDLDFGSPDPATQQTPSIEESLDASGTPEVTQSGEDWLVSSEYEDLESLDEVLEVDTNSDRDFALTGFDLEASNGEMPEVSDLEGSLDVQESPTAVRSEEDWLGSPELDLEGLGEGLVENSNSDSDGDFALTGFDLETFDEEIPEAFGLEESLESQAPPATAQSEEDWSGSSEIDLEAIDVGSIEGVGNINGDRDFTLTDFDLETFDEEIPEAFGLEESLDTPEISEFLQNEEDWLASPGFGLEADEGLVEENSDRDFSLSDFDLETSDEEIPESFGLEDDLLVRETPVPIQLEGDWFASSGYEDPKSLDEVLLEEADRNWDASVSSLDSETSDTGTQESLVAEKSLDRQEAPAANQSEEQDWLTSSGFGLDTSDAVVSESFGLVENSGVPEAPPSSQSEEQNWLASAGFGDLEALTEELAESVDNTEDRGISSVEEVQDESLPATVKVSQDNHKAAEEQEDRDTQGGTDTEDRDWFASAGFDVGSPHEELLEAFDTEESLELQDAPVTRKLEDRDWLTESGFDLEAADTEFFEDFGAELEENSFQASSQGTKEVSEMSDLEDFGAELEENSFQASSQGTKEVSEMSDLEDFGAGLEENSFQASSQGTKEVSEMSDLEDFGAGLEENSFQASSQGTKEVSEMSDLDNPDWDISPDFDLEMSDEELLEGFVFDEGLPSQTQIPTDGDLEIVDEVASRSLPPLPPLPPIPPRPSDRSGKESKDRDTTGDSDSNRQNNFSLPLPPMMPPPGSRPGQPPRDRGNDIYAMDDGVDWSDSLDDVGIEDDATGIQPEDITAISRSRSVPLPPRTTYSSSANFDDTGAIDRDREQSTSALFDALSDADPFISPESPSPSFAVSTSRGQEVPLGGRAARERLSEVYDGTEEVVPSSFVSESHLDRGKGSGIDFKDLWQKYLKIPSIVLAIALSGFGLFTAFSSSGVQRFILEKGLKAGLFKDASGKDLQGVDLKGAKLEQVNLSKANLTGANLEVANLSKANLTGANLTKANLTGANLTKASLSKAVLQGAKLKGTKTDAATTCPDGKKGPCRI